MLAISLDGRLAPPEGGAAQIGGRGDRRVLEEALAWSDAALLGAETLRRHGSTCLIHAPDLLARRLQGGLAPQPLALVASRSGHLPPGLPFFAQPLERWLLLQNSPGGVDPGLDTGKGPPDASPPECAAPDSGGPWSRASAEAPPDAGQKIRRALADPVGAGSSRAGEHQPGFARVLPIEDWECALQQLAALGLQRLVVLGGASLAASLLAKNLFDELQLTLCPQLLGGEHTWLGPGALVPCHSRVGWRLLEQRRLEGEELLLHYGRVAAGP